MDMVFLRVRIGTFYRFQCLAEKKNYFNQLLPLLNFNFTKHCSQKLGGKVTTGSSGSGSNTPAEESTVDAENDAAEEEENNLVEPNVSNYSSINGFRHFPSNGTLLHGKNMILELQAPQTRLNTAPLKLKTK